MTKLELFLQNASRKGDAPIVKLPNATGESGESGSEEGFGTLLKSISERPQGTSSQTLLVSVEVAAPPGEESSPGDAMSSNREKGDAVPLLTDSAPDVLLVPKLDQQLSSLIQTGLLPNNGAPSLSQNQAAQEQDNGRRSSASLLDILRLPVDENLDAGVSLGRIGAQVRASVVHQETHFKPIPAGMLQEVVKPQGNSLQGVASPLSPMLGASTQAVTSMEPQATPTATIEAFSAAQKDATIRAPQPTSSDESGSGEPALPLAVLQRIASAVVAEGKSASAQEPSQPSLSAHPMTHVVAKASEGAVRMLDIQLHPAELGKVTVKMRLSGDALEMELHASNETTAEMLRKDSEKLTSLLRTSGYKPETIVVVTAGADTQSQDNAGGQRQHSGGQSQTGGFQNGAAQSDEQSRRNSQGSESGAPKELKSGTNEKTGSSPAGDLYL